MMEGKKEQPEEEKVARRSKKSCIKEEKTAYRYMMWVQICNAWLNNNNTIKRVSKIWGNKWCVTEC